MGGKERESEKERVEQERKRRMKRETEKETEKERKGVGERTILFCMDSRTNVCTRVWEWV